MPILRDDLDQTYDANGKLISEQPRQRDVTADVNAETLRQKAQEALATNATYLGKATPTAAETSAQVKALTRQNTVLIRLVIGQLDDVSGT